MAKNRLDWVSMLLKEVTCVRATTLRNQFYYKLNQIFATMQKKQFNNRPKFERLSDKEWQEATNSVKQLVKWRLSGSKTCSGAHSESVLGMPAEDYYVGEV